MLLQALIDKLALDQEREAFAQENNRLKLLLKQYLEGQSVSMVIVCLSCTHPVEGLAYVYPSVYVCKF